MTEREFGFMRGLDIVVLVLLVLGALNWGVIGIFGFNVVDFLFGTVPWIGRIFYILVGLSGLYEVFGFRAATRRWHCTWPHEMVHTGAH